MGLRQRRNVAARLVRVFGLASNTGHVARFIVFGSFITSASAPNDVDIFLLMQDAFEVSQARGELAILFNHRWAQAYFGASIFWLRRLAALDGEQAAVEYWQTTRDGTRRGIVEVVSDDSK
jgi:hypothetical protein